MTDTGVIVDFDEAAERITGYPRGEAVGARMSELLIPARLRAAHEVGLRRYRETGSAPLLGKRFYMPCVCQDGTEITIELKVARKVVDGAAVFVGRMRRAGPAMPLGGELTVHADFHRTLVEQSPVLLFVVDENGDEAWSSPATEQLIGASSGRSVEDIISEIVHPADVETARTALARGASDGFDDPIDLRVRAPDGSWRALAVLARNLLGDPAVHGVAFYATDVTRARLAERQRRIEQARLATLLESLSVGVLLTDEQRRVVLANAAFVELFELGLPPEGLRGEESRVNQGFADSYADAETAHQRIDSIVGSGRPVVGEELPLANGRVVERDYTPVTMDGATLGHLWVFRDVTAQAEIRRSLEQRNQLLSELATLKTEFVAVISHELRTPLTSISTFANILTDDTALTAQERSRAVGALRRSADHMLRLVADLILLARLESGMLRLSSAPVDLPLLVRDAVETTAAAHPGIRLTTRIADGPPISGDPALLGQLVDTVLSVLVDGGAAGAELRVDANPTDDGWRLDVRTSAADAATSERLLSTRLPHPDDADEHRTGALALMLARAIVTRHGGALTMVMTRPGAQITVTLPLRYAAP